jgi:hypothetical protein
MGLDQISRTSHYRPFARPAFTTDFTCPRSALYVQVDYFRVRRHSGPVSGTCAADIWEEPFVALEKGFALGQGQKLLVKFLLSWN